MGIMGAVGIAIVLLAVAFLPETAGSELSDLDDEPEPAVAAPHAEPEAG
jgi:hypothetical protein